MSPSVFHKLTEKGREFVWTSSCQEAFETLKQRLTTAPILAHPDFSRPFILDTDASNDAIGAVLSQEVDGIERPISYAGRTLTKSERRYCVTRKELLAVVYFTTYFKHYLYGRKFTIRTDHGSLRWLLNFKQPECQMARWLQVLSSFNMEIKHRPGVQHKNADGLSRLPCNQCGYDPLWETSKVCSVQSNPLSDKGQVNDEESLQDKQEHDPDIALVKEWVKASKKPGFKEIEGELEKKEKAEGGLYIIKAKDLRDPAKKAVAGHKAHSSATQASYYILEDKKRQATSAYLLLDTARTVQANLETEQTGKFGDEDSEIPEANKTTRPCVTQTIHSSNEDSTIPQKKELARPCVVTQPIKSCNEDIEIPEEKEITNPCVAKAINSCNENCTYAMEITPPQMMSSIAKVPKGRWAGWTEEEENLLRQLFRDQIGTGMLIGTIRQRIGSQLSQYTTQQIRDKIRCLRK